MIDDAPDIEENGDDEYSIGWTERGPSSFGDNSDRENDAADNEPLAGSPERGEHRSQVGWCAGGYNDRERDCDDEGAQCDDEGRSVTFI